MAKRNHNMKKGSREGVLPNTFHFTLTHHGLLPILPAGKSVFFSTFSSTGVGPTLNLGMAPFSE
jgi:hypothetical protein